MMFRMLLFTTLSFIAVISVDFAQATCGYKVTKQYQYKTTALRLQTRLTTDSTDYTVQYMCNELQQALALAIEKNS